MEKVYLGGNKVAMSGGDCEAEVETPLNMVVMMIGSEAGRLSLCADQMRGITDRLVGEEPSRIEKEPNGGVPYGPGEYGEIKAAVDRLASAVTDIEHEVKRQKKL